MVSYLLPLLLSAGADLYAGCGPPPRGRRPWISQNDYPAEAIRRRIQGNVAFTLEISETGCPVKCTVTASSGHAVLDDATCKMMLERARFKPDVDENGAPVPGTWSNVMRWRL